MFYYSERPGTLAARKYPDDVPLAVKKRRLNEIIALQGEHSLASNRRDVGRVFRVLVEKPSRRSAAHLCGRNDQNKMIVFEREAWQPGQYVDVLVEDCTSATLIGRVLSAGEKVAQPEAALRTA